MDPLTLTFQLLAVILPQLKDMAKEGAESVLAIIRHNREALELVKPGLYLEIEDAYTKRDFAALSQLGAWLYDQAGPTPPLQSGEEAEYDDRLRARPRGGAESAAHPVPGEERKDG